MLFDLIYESIEENRKNGSWRKYYKRILGS
jgi:hypothetical protein